MTTTTTRLGRPSKDDLARREQREREAVVAQLARAVQHLNHHSRLSESPLCELPRVRARAASLRGQHFARARVVIATVRQAHEAAWAELGETADACCLRALADALQGRSREESARSRRQPDRDLAATARGGGDRRGHLPRTVAAASRG